MTELLSNQIVQLVITISLSISVAWIVKYFVRLFIERWKARKKEGFVMQIIPPKYQLEELQNKQGERFALQRFIDNLTASVKNSRISFEIFSNHDGIKFLVWTPTKPMQDLVKLNLYSTYKDRVKIKTLDHDPIKSFRKEFVEINEYKSLKHDVYMLMDVRDFESMDPINDLLIALSGQKKNSTTLFQIVLKPSEIDKEALNMAKQNYRLVKNEITWVSLFLNRFESYLIYAVPLLPLAILKTVSALFKSFSNEQNTIDPLTALPDSDPRKIFVDKDELQSFYSRMDEKYKTSFTSYIRVVAQGDGAKQKLDSIEQALESMKSETQNRLVRKQVHKLNDVITRFIYPEDKFFPFYREMFTSQGSLSSREISMLYHLPNRISDPQVEHFIAPDIASKKIYRSKQNMDDLELGINYSREKSFKVYLPCENRKRHIVVTGQTGTGKSTILKRFILQDIDNLINKGNKRGLMLMDPHEDFFFDILQRLPNSFEQSNKIITWDTRSEDYYFGFNPLYAIGLSEREIDLIVDSNFKLIEKVVKRSNPDSGMGMTGKPMLINAIKTLMIFQNDWIASFGSTPEAIQFMSSHAPTLIDVRNLFFSDKMESNVLKVIDLNKYEGLRAFWQDTLPNYKTSQNWQEIRQGFDNKLSQILTGILMYTFGQSRNAINISNIIRQSKVLLVNLSSKNIGEEGMSLLGSLLMSKVWFETKKVNRDERRPFVVYADEFQNFASSDFSQALSEARKFKLELVLAHQFFKQLPDDVFHSVMGNVKNKIYYRCGLEDSEIISKELQGKVLEQEVMEVPEFNANVKAGEDIFSIYIPEEREVSFSKEYVNNFICNSYLRYGKNKSEIEQEIKNRRTWIIDGCKFE
jgi:GTPase SAR1 family protein